jgi:hypothetical protein
VLTLCRRQYAQFSRCEYFAYAEWYIRTEAERHEANGPS